MLKKITMKKFTFILFACICVFNYSFSQNKKTTEMLEEISGLYEIDDNGHITYSRVIETENLTKDEMYSRALSYFIYNYNDANSVIQEQDKEDGRLIGKGIVKKVHTGVGMVVLVFDFWHILRIDIKENKFRALLTLTEYRTELSSLDGKTPPTISNTKISSQYPLNPKGPMKNFNGKAFFSTHNKAISILDAIEKSVKEGNTSKSVENNDW